MEKRWRETAYPVLLMACLAEAFGETIEIDGTVAAAVAVQ